MTLGRQLILSGMLVLLGLFTGMIVFTVQNTQQFLNHQLSTHAQDTATVLGLSLSHVMKENDPVMAGRMVDSIWDSGYYQNIEVDTLKGAPLVTREMEVKVAGVPNWFIQSLKLKTEKRSALIQSGWMQVGKVTVESNPGFAYKQIWETLSQSILWLLVISVLAMMLGLLLLHVILKPLRNITRQAYAICNQDFMIQEKLPWTIDLRQVVEAMNTMSSRLKNIFEEQVKVSESLRQQAFQSPVTGLGNRRYFDMQFQFMTQQASDQSGFMLLLELYDFKNFNDKYGYEKGDELLKAAAHLLSENTEKQGQKILAHLGGADFALIMPNKTDELAKEIADKILKALIGLNTQGLLQESNVAHIGLTLFQPEEDQKTILSRADMALRQAQATGPNQYKLHQEQAGQPAMGAQAWGKRFDTIFAKEEIVLYFQPYHLFAMPKDKRFHETLLRIKDETGKVIPAGLFMPMAERLHRMPEFDQLVLKKVCERLRQEEGKHPLSVNISVSSLEDPSFEKFLMQQVKQLGKLAGSLVVEFPEYGVIHQLEKMNPLLRQLRNLGTMTAIDNYGRNFTSFAYLHSLSLSFLKIDGSYIRNIHQSEENQFFIRSLVNIAHSLDIKIIAEAVETEDELTTLKDLKVDGIQGYLLGKPQETLT